MPFASGHIVGAGGEEWSISFIPETSNGTVGPVQQADRVPKQTDGPCPHRAIGQETKAQGGEMRRPGRHSK